MNVENYIRRLGIALGLPGLALDANNVCRVVLDGNSLDFERVPEKDELFVVSVVCPLPASGREALFYRLLQGNHLGVETGDATFSIDAEQEEVLLYRKLNLGVTDYESFEQAVCIFYSRLLNWKQRCASCLDNAPVSAPEQAVPLAGGVLRV